MTTSMTTMQASLLTMFAQFLASGLFHKFCMALVILVVGVLAIRIIGKILGKTLEKSKLEKAAHTLISSLVKTALYILLGLVVASTLGIDVTSVVALASVLTLALSLALQNMVSNIIGGFTILYTQPFHSGDYVEIAGQAGTVQEINMSYTKLSTPDNKVISIPNSAVVAAEIVNYTVAGTRRVDVVISASYDAPVELVLETLKEAGRLPTVLSDRAPFAAVKNYGESSIEYVLQLWCASGDYWTTLFDAHRIIKAVFDAKGIEMTYPHLNVHIQK